MNPQSSWSNKCQGRRFSIKSFRKLELFLILGLNLSVCMSLYSLLLLFCVSVSSSELEPEPIDELSWLSWGNNRKSSPSSERDGVSVRERILSRLFGLISFFIFRVIQLPRLWRKTARQGVGQRQKYLNPYCHYSLSVAACSSLEALQIINIWRSSLRMQCFLLQRRRPTRKLSLFKKKNLTSFAARLLSFPLLFN